jgi:hypothetical protein
MSSIGIISISPISKPYCSTIRRSLLRACVGVKGTLATSETCDRWLLGDDRPGVGGLARRRAPGGLCLPQLMLGNGCAHFHMLSVRLGSQRNRDFITVEDARVLMERLKRTVGNGMQHADEFMQKLAVVEVLRRSKTRREPSAMPRKLASHLPYFVLRFLLVPFVAGDTDLVSSAICMQLRRSR